MRSPDPLRSRLVLALAGWALAAALAAGAEPVVVAVRPGASVVGDQVLVRHVAVLSGGDAALRERIAALDLADAPRRHASLTLQTELISYRIRLAGIDRADFRVEGAQRSLVSRGEGPSPDNPVVVKPRDLVTLMTRAGTVRVVTRGEVLQDGRAGDKVRVRNVDSKKEVVGRVIDRGLVEVEY